MKYVCDTSVIINAKVLDYIKDDTEFIIPCAVLCELEHHANSNKETGFAGFSVLQKLKKRAQVSIIGTPPTDVQIKFAKKGEIDRNIREIARETNSILLTSDRVQYEMAQIHEINSIYVKDEKLEGSLSVLSKYFTKDTMSVHLKEGTKAKAKIGTPGNFILKEILEEKLSEEEVRDLAKTLVETSKRTKNSFQEIEEEGATVLKIKDYRIVITKPPFSDAFEITITKPIKKMKLEDYNLDFRLLNRIKEESEGILVCGKPGSGKSTFAASVANYFLGLGKIVKTMESPRDLQVEKEITQYTKLDNTFEKTNDIMLLVRPDYSVYDEVRKTQDFLIYADMRFAGIGLIGVVHALRPIDSIQRFINRIELGMIPQIIDTIIFIKDGKVNGVLCLKLTMKVPYGMRDADLSRPVIEVKDFFEEKILYEIYKFGEETVVLELNQVKDFKQKAKKSKIEFANRKVDKILNKNCVDEFQINIFEKKININLSKRDFEKVNDKFSRKFKNIEKKFKTRIIFDTY